MSTRNLRILGWWGLTTGLAMLGYALVIYAARTGQLDWADTPAGHAALGWLLLAVLVTVPACLGIRTAHRDRATREAQEWDELDEWEEAMELTRAQQHWRDEDRDYMRWQDDIMKDIRRVTRADMDREADRIEAELRADAMPQAVREWPQPVSPRLTDWAVSAAAPAPLPPRYWLGESKPIAEVESLTGAAAWFANDMRTGVDVTDNILDAIVPVSGGPRHTWGSNRGTDTQRSDPAFVSWERPTGALPIVRTSKVLVSV